MAGAGITLLKGALRGVAKAISLSRAVMREQAGLLLSPIIAGAAMNLSSVSVIGNALRWRHLEGRRC